MCQRVRVRREFCPHGLSELRHAFGEDDAIRVHEPVHFVDQGHALADEPLPHPGEGVEILLGNILRGYKAHGRPRHGFRDGFGIAHVILVRLDKGRDELGRHALDLMTMLAEAPGPVMGSPHASRPMRTGGSCARKGIRAWRVSRLRHSIVPVVSPPTR